MGYSAGLIWRLRYVVCCVMLTIVAVTTCVMTFTTVLTLSFNIYNSLPQLQPLCRIKSFKLKFNLNKKHWTWNQRSKSFTSQTDVGISAGFPALRISPQLLQFTNFLITTTRFSTHGFQHFSLPLNQHNATSKSVQQNIPSTQTLVPIAKTNSLTSWLSKNCFSWHFNNCKWGTLKGFIGTTLVLDIKKLNFTPDEVSTRM